MDRQSVKRRWRSILRQSMLLQLVLVIMAAIVLAALWCWTKWLTPPSQVDTLLAIGVLIQQRPSGCLWFSTPPFLELVRPARGIGCLLPPNSIGRIHFERHEVRCPCLTGQERFDDMGATLHGYGPKLAYQGSDTIGYADTRIRRRIRIPAVSVNFSFKKLIK
jgi:hypothetical protein